MAKTEFFTLFTYFSAPNAVNIVSVWMSPWTAGPQFSGRHQEEINCLQSWSLSPSYHLKPPCHLICTPPSLSPPYHLGIPSVGFHGKTMDTEADEITSFVLEPCQFCESSSSTCFPILCFVLTALIVPILSQPHHYANPKKNIFFLKEGQQLPWHWCKKWCRDRCKFL